jgi:Cof subfamily protein (haloacid dehalogenase superfamily)
VTFTPRLVALDIDGTLFAPIEGTGNIDETVTAGVQAAIDRVIAAGVPIVLATGRSTYGTTRVWDAIGLPRGDEQVMTVASNGAVTFSYAPVEILDTVTFDASEVVRLLLEHVPQAMVAVEEVGIGFRVNRHFPEGEITGEMLLQSVDELVSEPVTRVIIRDPHSSEEDFVELAEKLGLHGTNYFIGWTAWLDLAPQGVTKASALAKVAEHYGVRREDVLAIGDGRNDTDMLQWAGRGVAMGQAPLEVQEAADFVTESVYRDGVAQELLRWF